KNLAKSFQKNRLFGLFVAASFLKKLGKELSKKQIIWFVCSRKLFEKSLAKTFPLFEKSLAKTFK
ncbi:MAG: hypothetical protein MR471_03605, partial [Clostridia bacterium]|nr:hypothetical protein [Clostridia bacterium]